MNQRLHGWLFLLALFVAPASVGQDWVNRVLRERDPAQKERLVSLGEMTPEALALLLRRERHGPAVAAAVGRYFEKNQLDASAPDLLVFAVSRPDIGAQAAVYAAVSPSAPQMIAGLADQDGEDARRVAARLAAAYALMRTHADRKGIRPPGANPRQGPQQVQLRVDFSQVIRSLITGRDEQTLEYALLAAAWDGVELDAAIVEKLADSREQGLAMAAQFYRASTGGEVDADRVLETITRKPGRRGRNAGLAPLGYETRATPRHYAVMAAGRADLSDAIDSLIELLTDEDVTLAVEAARSLGLIEDPSIPGRLLEQFGRELAWPVRVAVYDALGRQPDKASIPALRQRYDAERGRLRQDALYAMLSIIAGRCNEPNISSFDFWWRDNGEAFEVDLQATMRWRAQNPVQTAQVREWAGFYDAKVISDRPVFVVDASASMKGAQIESLKMTLSDTVLMLPEHIQFNIVDFGGHCRVLAPGGLIPAANREAAMQRFNYEMRLTYGTRSYDAMEDAVFLPGMDTIHFLSDGAPVNSELNHWTRIAYAQRVLFRYVPVAVNIVYFPEGGAQGVNPNNPQVRRMRGLTNMHAGQFVISGAQ
ncbi:MAG: hypothetical protein AAGH88_02630 [Planctomycetota bacterium]